jgi:hypothetical protein
MTVIIYPLLAKTFRFLRGPAFYFSDEYYLTSVSELDHGTILRYCPAGYQNALQSRFRCVYYRPTADVSDGDVANAGRLLTFTLNCFSNSDPIDIPVSVSIEDNGRRRAAKFKMETSEQMLLPFSQLHYRVVEGTVAGDFQKVFSLTMTALQNDKRVSIMLDRFNSSLRRAKLEDRIIDLTVALEAMLNESNEIMFRLSLYLAFTSQQNRAAAYELFKTLYSVRSKIVHGSLHESRAQRDLENISEKMPEIIKYAKASMLYFFAYLNTPEPRNWSQHCLDLVLGSAQPVV